MGHKGCISFLIRFHPIHIPIGIDDSQGIVIFDHDTGNLPINRQNELLKQENERLTGKVDRLEERLAVLERIAGKQSRTWRIVINRRGNRISAVFN